jgi:hypothetical protein
MADALPPGAHLAASFCSSRVKRSPACDACRAHPRRARPRAPLHCRERRRYRSSLCGSANMLTSPVAMTVGESGAASNESNQFTRRVTPESPRSDETAARWCRGLLTLTCDPRDEVPGGTRRSPGMDPGTRRICSRLGFRQRLLGLQRVVDDDVGAAPGRTPPTEVAIGQPCGVVSNSPMACCRTERRVGRARWYHSLVTMRRQSWASLSARSCA